MAKETLFCKRGVEIFSANPEITNPDSEFTGKVTQTILDAHCLENCKEECVAKKCLQEVRSKVIKAHTKLLGS